MFHKSHPWGILDYPDFLFPVVPAATCPWITLILESLLPVVLINSTPDFLGNPCDPLVPTPWNPLISSIPGSGQPANAWFPGISAVVPQPAPSQRPLISASSRSTGSMEILDSPNPPAPGACRSVIPEFPSSPGFPDHCRSFCPADLLSDPDFQLSPEFAASPLKSPSKHPWNPLVLDAPECLETRRPDSSSIALGIALGHTKWRCWFAGLDFRLPAPSIPILPSLASEIASADWISLGLPVVPLSPAIALWLPVIPWFRPSPVPWFPWNRLDFRLFLYLPPSLGIPWLLESLGIAQRSGCPPILRHPGMPWRRLETLIPLEPWLRLFLSSPYRPDFPNSWNPEPSIGYPGIPCHPWFRRNPDFRIVWIPAIMESRLPGHGILWSGYPLNCTSLISAESPDFQLFPLINPCIPGILISWNVVLHRLRSGYPWIACHPTGALGITDFAESWLPACSTVAGILDALAIPWFPEFARHPWNRQFPWNPSNPWLRYRPWNPLVRRNRSTTWLIHTCPWNRRNRCRLMILVLAKSWLPVDHHCFADLGIALGLMILVPWNLTGHLLLRSWNPSKM